MYVHAGNNKTINNKEIIGFFDLDTSTISAVTRKFLVDAEKSGIIETVKEEIPKSFVLTDKKIYITQIATSTLLGRINEHKSLKG